LTLFDKIFGNFFQYGKMIKSGPDIKRTICKSCNSCLIPGKTATFKVKYSSHKKRNNKIGETSKKESTSGANSTSKGAWLEITCNTCKRKKKIPANFAQK